LLNEQKFSEAETNSLGGYSYLTQHVSQTNGYLGNARKDLAAIYDGLHQPEKAARFRAELAHAAANAPTK
jgi:serine/threonine-protein kinase